MRAEWELNSGFSRLGLRNKRGKKPQWAWNKKSGKLVRDDQKGGIDWWRYQSEILIPKLLPFAKACLIDRPETLVQEDKAPSHSHAAQQKIYNLWAVTRLIWPGNSPDLNPIEPAWYWMKRRTTSKGPPTTRKAATETWLHWWRELPQENIQAWIERIPRHIEEIIRLEGGNEYKEGRVKLFDKRLPQIIDVRGLEDSEEELSEEEEWYDCDE
jgi:transposase